MYSKLIPTTTPQKFVEVKLDYRKGGMNYFTSSMMKRGYYLGVTPVTIEEHDGYRTKMMAAFTGYCACLLEVKRASTGSEIAAGDLAMAREAELVKAVCEKNGLSLA